MQTSLRQVGDAVEDAGEPGVRVDVVQLGGADQGVHHRPCSPLRSEPANTGSTIPLPETESIRAATGDPRPSIEQRYGDADGYVAAIVTAAERLVADGLMLEEDIARVEQRARNWSRPLHDVRL